MKLFSGGLKVVQLFSGGLDSTVLAYHLATEVEELRLLSIYYGQRHGRELDAAMQIAAQLSPTEWRSLDLSALGPMLAGSSQTDPSVAVPEGHYAEDTMKATVVPNRNMILMSLATAWAVSTRSAAVAYAAHAGDHAVYPDCRPEFVAVMRQAMALCDYEPVGMLAPFITWTKAAIVTRGAALGVPFELTWSCYQGRDIHCGRCGTCVERAEAFSLAGVDDPTRYESPDYWREVVSQ